MRRFSWPILGLLILLTPTLAAAQGVELTSGQKVTATMDDGGDVHLFRFHAIEGDLITIQFAAQKKSGLEPVLRLIGPDDEFVLPALVKGKMALKKLAIPAAGPHQLLVYGAGSEGKYTFTFKQKHEKVEPETRKIAAKYSVTLPAGAKVTIEVKAEKGSDLYPGIDRIVDPAGNDILDEDYLKEKKKKAKVTIPACPCFGRYVIYLTNREGTGSAIIKTKIKPAKPWTKKLTDETGFDSLIAMVRHPDGMGWDYEINAEALGDGVVSAYMRFPENSGRKDEALVDDDGDLRYTGQGMFPDGIYTLVVNLKNGAVVEKPFLLGGSWPDPVQISLTDGSSETPLVTWTGGNGTAIFVMEVMEWDTQDGDWNNRFFTLLPGAADSEHLPDGPLDAVPHAIEMYGISEGLKATFSSYYPK